MVSRKKLETFLNVSHQQKFFQNVGKTENDPEEIVAFFREQGLSEEDIAVVITRVQALNKRAETEVENFVFNLFSSMFTDEEMDHLITIYQIPVMEKLFIASQNLLAGLQNLVLTIMQDANAEIFNEELLRSIPPDTKGS